MEEQYHDLCNTIEKTIADYRVEKNKHPNSVALNVDDFKMIGDVHRHLIKHLESEGQVEVDRMFGMTIYIGRHIKQGEARVGEF